MAGKKDRTVVAVISGLTSRQASEVSKGIMNVKQKSAPFGRGTIASTFTENAGLLIQRGTKRIGGK